MLFKRQRDQLYTYRHNVKTSILRWHNKCCHVLLYHRVTNLSADPQLLAVSPDNFYEQIRLIKNRYHLLSIDEFDHIITYNKNFPRNCFIVTFDDGYADNLQEALPVLESLNAQALFFIATATIGTRQEFWWDELERIFLVEQTSFPEKVVLQIDTKKYQLMVRNQQEKTEAYRQLHPIIKPLYPDVRQYALNQLISQAGLPDQGRSSHRVLTWEELSLFANSNAVRIGCHTHNHVQLSALSLEDQTNEILLSKKLLESHLNIPITHFSYPFGTRTDFDIHTKNICQDLNIPFAYANIPGAVLPNVDPLSIPRHLIRNWGTDFFNQSLKHIIHAYSPYLYL